MGILHIRDTQKNVVFIVWDGEVTADSWFRQAGEMLSGPDWPVTSRFIVDVQTASDNSSIGDQEMEKVAALFGTHPATRGKRAAVIANSLFGRAKKFGTLISRFGVSLVVFTGLDTACTFLGIDPAETRETLEQLRSRLRTGSNR